MSARYILRLDDACPTMLTEIWNPLENLLDELGIKPIVGVIPDNRDPKLYCSPIDTSFWSRVRNWESKGWSIALHGLHHVYHTIPGNCRPILNLSHQSEFVGLSLDQQKLKISTGYEIMAKAGVLPRIFMAPSHSFDQITLQALHEVSDIRIIADGHTLGVVNSDGFTWIPQQLWRFRKIPFGTWGICLHPNTMSFDDLTEFSNVLRLYHSSFVDLNAAINVPVNNKVFNLGVSIAYKCALRIKQFLRK